MSSFDSLLAIDVKRAVQAIETYIQREMNSSSSQGVIMGLSGGIDSAVLAALAVRALGKKLVNVYYLYDRDSSKQLGRRAELVADSLGLALQLQNIEPAMRQKRIYEPLTMRIIALSGLVNRLIANVYRSLSGEACFDSSLHEGRLGGYGLRQFFYHYVIQHIEAGFNARHIHRRQLLEKVGKEKDWLLSGAANRSEYLTGWFVKGGIDDIPFSPLVGLYKSQIRQIAAFLGLPHEIQAQSPSADMMKGITDEFALGTTYGTLDVILDGLERGLADEQIAAAGIGRGQITRFRRIVQLSAWKRGSESLAPPVDGRFCGGFRIHNVPAK